MIRIYAVVVVALITLAVSPSVAVQGATCAQCLFIPAVQTGDVPTVIGPTPVTYPLPVPPYAPEWPAIAIGATRVITVSQGVTESVQILTVEVRNTIDYPVCRVDLGVEFTAADWSTQTVTGTAAVTLNLDDRATVPVITPEGFQWYRVDGVTWVYCPEH